MTTEKMVTERAAILRERGAFVSGYFVGVADRGVATGGATLDADAKHRYPLPKVTRPHVMTVLDTGGYDMRVIDGIPQYRRGAGVWTDIDTFGAPRLTVNGARVLVALLANPTEEVEAQS